MNDDPPSHGTWVMSVPTSTTLPEKGWEWRGEAGMPSAVGPGDHTSDKGGRGERRKSQQFMDLCMKFGGEGGAKDKLENSLSDNLDIRSEDTVSVSKQILLFQKSKIKQDEKMDPQQKINSNFSSLRGIWEPASKQARKPVLLQRRIVLSDTGFSLVRSSPNKRKGGNMNNGSAGKKNRPG